MMGPDYARPTVDAPAAFRFEPKEVADTANTEWWKQFGDPVLDELIAEALANNLNVKIAAANVEQALARAHPDPLGAVPAGRLLGKRRAGAHSRGRDSSPSTPELSPIRRRPTRRCSRASWEIDLWGRIRRLSESAQANMLATDEARRGVILTLVSSVATNYLTLRGLDEQLVIAKSTLGTYGESVRLYQLQFKYGQTSQMTVSQAQSQYETAAAQIPQIESQIAQTENALSILLGRNPGPIPRGKSIYDLALPAVPAGVPSALLERRPDLMQAEQSLDRRQRRRSAPPRPSTSRRSRSPGRSAAPAPTSRTCSRDRPGSGTTPVRSSGRSSRSARSAARWRRPKPRNRPPSSTISSRSRTRSPMSTTRSWRMQKLKDQLAAQERLVAALKDYARLAKLQYDGGYTAYSTVLQAEQTLFPAELTLAAVRASVFGSAANIYKAMGGGWVGEADRLTTGGAAEPVDERAARQPLF